LMDRARHRIRPRIRARCARPSRPRRALGRRSLPPGRRGGGRTSLMAGCIFAAAFAVVFVACKSGPVDPPGAAPSPQAAAEPAPFANPPVASATANASRDAGPPPEPLRSDQALVGDVPRELAPREGGTTRDTRELAGYALQAVLRTGEGPPPPRATEVNIPAIDAARRRAETRIAIEMSTARARFVLSPGALRALFGERRLDVAPLSRGDVANAGEGARRLNLRTRRAEVATRAAKATFELATLHDID